MGRRAFQGSVSIALCFRVLGSALAGCGLSVMGHFFFISGALGPLGV